MDLARALSAAAPTLTQRNRHRSDRRHFEAGTIVSFKKHLDSYMGKMGIEGYGPSVGNWD